MKGILIAGVFVITFLSAVSLASAQFTSQVNYPDGSISVNQNLGFGLNAHIFFDVPGDFDIFTHHTDAVGAFTPLALRGFPAGFAYWLNFLGPVGTRLLYDVFLTQGGAFFFVGQFLL